MSNDTKQKKQGFGEVCGKQVEKGSTIKKNKDGTITVMPPKKGTNKK